LGKLEQTTEILDRAAADAVARTGSKRALCFYSGGKESRTICALAHRKFDQVVGVFMYLKKGLACVEEALDDGRRRHGMEIVQLPHWILARMLKANLYRPPLSPEAIAAIPDLTVRDVYDWSIESTGIQVILTGAKAADSLWRRRTLKAVQYAEIYHPIASWLKVDVIQFLAANGIPIPDSSGHSATGIDLTAPSLEWLHRRHPADFALLAEDFPFIWATVWRRRFYSLPSAAP
jgi:3'-phosphoadenosine 5'-phosphosulfate sulfotransferase (PAPS reductase)/FAD synthetase